MKHRWTVIYYEIAGGKCPVEDFVISCSLKNRAKILSIFALLEEKGPNLPRPYSDLLEDGIHELRIKLSGRQARILYFFCYRDFIILSHAFNKTTEKVPKLEIEKTKKHRADFLFRIKENTLRKEQKDEDF